MPPPPPPDGSSFGGYGGGRSNFYSLLGAAIRDIEENGFDSVARIEDWCRRIREAAIASMTPPHVLEAALNDTMRAIYTRMVERGGMLRMHPGLPRFTLDRVKPRLRAALDRRIMANVSLIRLNQTSAVEKTIQRLSGWATSIPAGGSDAVDKGEVKADIRKALASLPFEERRVIVDQSHKLTGELNNILAVDGGAIAVVWKSHFRQAGYNYRPDHKERDGQVYMLRGNWAAQKGLMKPGPAGYYDEITSVGQEVFCRCYAAYVYTLRALPDDMLTQKGAAELERVRLARAA